MAFRVICAGDVPDHVTVARFRAGLGGGAGALFAEVLGLCARLGMGQLGVIALDGMKIAASASVKANRDEDRLRRLAEGMVAAHAAADAAEDGLFGEGVRGDEVPADLADPRTRAERIAAALADLKAEREAAAAQRDAQAQEYLARAAAGQRRRGGTPAAAAVAAARLRHEQARAARREQLAALAARAAGPRGARRAPGPAPRRRRGLLPGQGRRRGAGEGRGPRRCRGRPPAAGREGPGPAPGPQHHRPALAADADPRRVHPGLQRPERHQR